MTAAESSPDALESSASRAGSASAGSTTARTEGRAAASPLRRRSSATGKRRCPPLVRTTAIRPVSAQRRTVLAETPQATAASPRVTVAPVAAGAGRARPRAVPGGAAGASAIGSKAGARRLSGSPSRSSASIVAAGAGRPNA